MYIYVVLNRRVESIRGKLDKTVWWKPSAESLIRNPSLNLWVGNMDLNLWEKAQPSAGSLAGN
jgi:hypothetical protein